MVAFLWPGLTALVLLFLIAIRLVVVGVFELVAGIRPPVPMEDRGWVIFSGIISIVFGVVLMLLPVAGVLAIIWLIGAFAVVFGIVECVFSFRLRSGSLSPSTCRCRSRTEGRGWCRREAMWGRAAGRRSHMLSRILRL